MADKFRVLPVYLAKVNRASGTLLFILIPLVTLQCIVGHMDKRMTEAYMMHQTEELKRNAINRYSMTSLLPEKKESLSKISIQDNQQDQSQSRGGFKF